MKRAVYIALLIILCVLCNGCDSWMGGEYLSVTPHEAQAEDYVDRVIEVTSYTQLRNAVENLVRSGADNGIISISAFNKGTIHFYVDTAISNVIENTPFGSYAVEKITYEIGTNRGVSVVACKVHYRTGYQQPSKIKRITNADDLSESIFMALDGIDTSVLVYMEQYEKLDIETLINEYAHQYPERIIEIPTVEFNVYPEKGAERIVEISFEYQTDRIVLQQMRAKISESIGAALVHISELREPIEIYSSLYDYLTKNYQYNGSVVKTPLYNMLVKGEGSERTLAEAYTLLCIQSGLNCKTISGTINGLAWTWNAVQINGSYHEVDLQRCNEVGEFSLLTEEELTEYHTG